MLLGGKLRNPSDKSAVLEVIQKHFRRTVIESHLFGSDGGTGSVATSCTLKLLKTSLPLEFSHLVWTPELLMMAVLVHRALSFNEPVLVIGGTGYVGDSSSSKATKTWYNSAWCCTRPSCSL